MSFYTKHAKEAKDARTNSGTERFALLPWFGLFAHFALKSLVVLVFGILAFHVAGCTAVTDKIRDLREKAATRGTPHVRTFAVDRRAAYAAALAALPKVGLQYQRGGPAQGELEAISEQSAEGNGNRRSQLVLTVRFVDTLDGSSEVRTWLEEYIETDARKSSGRATGAPAPDLSLYEAFFNALAAGLKK